MATVNCEGGLMWNFNVPAGSPADEDDFSAWSSDVDESAKNKIFGKKNGYGYTSSELNENLNVISLTEIAADFSTGYQFLVLAPRGLAILLFL